MMQSARLCAGVWNSRRAVTAIEYGIMAGLIAVALTLAMVSLNAGISTEFRRAAQAIPTS